MVVAWVIGEGYDTRFMHKNAIVVNLQLELGQRFCDMLQLITHSILFSIRCKITCKGLPTFVNKKHVFATKVMLGIYIYIYI